MAYSISASLYYPTISTFLDHPIFQSITYLRCLKILYFIGLFDVFHYLAKNQSLLSQLIVFKFDIFLNFIIIHIILYIKICNKNNSLNTILNVILYILVNKSYLVF